MEDIYIKSLAETFYNKYFKGKTNLTKQKVVAINEIKKIYVDKYGTRILKEAIPLMEGYLKSTKKADNKKVMECLLNFTNQLIN